MKQLLLTAAAAVALSGCIIVDLDGEAYAQGGRSVVGGDLTVTLDEPGDFRLTGADIEASGRVEGVLSVAGADFRGRALSLGGLDANLSDLRFDGEVDGAVDVNGADVRWDGPVGGDVSLNAADIDWSGDVDGAFRANMADGAFEGRFSEMRLNAADIEFRPGAAIGALLRVNAAELEFAGRAGALDAVVRTARISGAVDGDAAIYADPGRRPHGRDDGLVEITGAIGGGEICARRVVIDGRVDGPLSVTADAEPELSGDALGADISFTPRDGRRCERPDR